MQTLAHYPKTVSIVDGQVVIRPMAQEDFDGVRRFFEQLPRQDRLFLRHDVLRPEVFSRWFAELDYGKKLPLMALHGEHPGGGGRCVQKAGGGDGVGAGAIRSSDGPGV